MWEVRKALPRALTDLPTSSPTSVPHHSQHLRHSPPTQVSPFPSKHIFCPGCVLPLNVLFLKEGNGQTGDHSVDLPRAPCNLEPGPGALPLGSLWSTPRQPCITLFLQRNFTAQSIGVRNFTAQSIGVEAFCPEVLTRETEDHMVKHRANSTKILVRHLHSPCKFLLSHTHSSHPPPPLNFCLCSHHRLYIHISFSFCRAI